MFTRAYRCLCWQSDIGSSFQRKNTKYTKYSEAAPVSGQRSRVFDLSFQISRKHIWHSCEKGSLGISQPLGSHCTVGSTKASKAMKKIRIYTKPQAITYSTLVFSNNPCFLCKGQCSSQPVRELLTGASCEKDRKRTSAESSLMSP